VTTRRLRVLFFADAVTLAHVARAAVLARTLDPAEFDVHLAWDPRYDTLLGPLPFQRHTVWSLPTGEFLRRVASGRPLHDVRMLRRYVRDDLDVIRRVDPDLVVSDFRVSLAASARLAGTPLVTVANAYWSPFGRQTFMFDHYDYPLSGLVGNRAARGLFRAFRSIGFAAHARPLNKVLREHGLPTLGNDIRTLYTFGDVTAYADMPALYSDLALPASHRFIGPAVWSPAIDLPPWWNKVPSDRPLIYVTLGSSGEASVLERVLRAIADLPLTVVAATAGRQTLEGLPDNVYVSAFVPGADAAARAALVISNGGSPTTYQALLAGVPVLALASNNMDQHLNMEAVRLQGAGRLHSARRVTSAWLRQTVREMIDDPRLLRNARQVAAKSRSDITPAAVLPELFRSLVRG
jgi:UDP:flavonoid glycosyltransferase YjiC (YdhE family)